ncbi:MAG: AAA family ATPase [Bacteroidales bacterium]|nr:AAA family ATPase [Bacteroidales bacterium]
MDKIKIHNFGPIKDIDIKLSKLMVFIGPQGAGKSAFAKLLTIFSDIYWWTNICKNNNPLSEFKKMEIVNYFAPDTYIEYYGRNDVNIRYRDGKFSISIKDLSQQEIYDYCKMLISSSYSDNIIDMGLDIVDNQQVEKSIKDNLNFLRANLRYACYIPAERNLAGAVSSSLANIILSKIPLPNTLMEYLSLFERAKNHFPIYNATFLGVEYDKNHGSNCISVLGDIEKYLSLEECSSGIQSALPMLMITDFAREEKYFDSYVVEEPEQNLFPTNQREVLNKLISIANSDECTYMVITTHSPYLLSALNVSMLANNLRKVDVNKKEEVDSIVPPQFQIDSADVSVYSLGGREYCESIKDERTGIVSVNYLDVVSDSIGADFNKLYHLYLKTLQK